MPLIVIEGLDGSGKATNAALLAKRLENEGKTVELITFPDYKSDSSALVRMYLNGCFGDKPGDVNAYAASAFYAVDRYASYRTSWGEKLKNGAWVIADRYTTSNAVHQASKLDSAQRGGFLDWLYDFEYEKLGLPMPDCVIYIDIPTQVSQQLISKRYSGNEQKKDIHEKDKEYLEQTRESALDIAKRLNWHIIEPCAGGTLLPPDDVCELIYGKITELYGNKF